MEKKKRDEPRQTLSLNVVLAIALLFLSVIMIKTAFTQFFASRILGGCINALGGLLFFGVSMTLLKELCSHLQKNKNKQEDSNDGC